MCNLHKVQGEDDDPLKPASVYPWVEVEPEQQPFITSAVFESWPLCCPVPVKLPGEGVQTA